MIEDQFNITSHNPVTNELFRVIEQQREDKDFVGQLILKQNIIPIPETLEFLSNRHNSCQPTGDKEIWRQLFYSVVERIDLKGIPRDQAQKIETLAVQFDEDQAAKKIELSKPGYVFDLATEEEKHWNDTNFFVCVSEEDLLDIRSNPYFVKAESLAANTLNPHKIREVRNYVIDRIEDKKQDIMLKAIGWYVYKIAEAKALYDDFGKGVQAAYNFINVFKNDDDEAIRMYLSLDKITFSNAEKLLELSSSINRDFARTIIIEYGSTDVRKIAMLKALDIEDLDY